MRYQPKILLIIPLFLVCITSHAQTLALPTNTNSSRTIISTPAKGMTMQQVEENFGPPHDKLPAAGDPPISRWIYDDFTVYFERQYIIHAVVHH